MRPIRRQHLKHDLIDFAASEPSGGLTFHEHLSAGPVTLAHASSRPVEGRHLAASQVIVAIHEGKAFEMNWHGVESDRVQSITVTHGQTHIGDARLPFWVRHSASPSFFAIALDESFVGEIWEKAFDRAGDFSIQASIGIEDPVIGRLGARHNSFVSRPRRTSPVAMILCVGNSDHAVKQSWINPQRYAE